MSEKPTEPVTEASAQVFSFGDPEPVLDRRGLLDYTECWINDRWYEPPVNLRGLVRLLDASVHHASALKVKHNILLSTMMPTPLLSRADASRVFKEYLTLGNCYLERQRARSGKTVGFRASLALYTRRGVDLGQYYFLAPGQVAHEFKPGSIWHLLEPDLSQEVYGVPDYLSATNSVLLAESATLFRRRYYQNGSHAGFILYMNDPAQKQEDIDAIRKALKDSKGPGNFRNMFVYSPNGKKDGLQLIPVSEVAAKDEFSSIKQATRDDQLAAHRVPWQLMGMPPASGVQYGDPKPVAEVFARNELEPLQAMFFDANAFFGEEIFRFKPYAIGENHAPLLP